MPLMGSLYIGTSGLQTSQNLLNTTAHNLTNVDTEGYTRQQSLLGTKDYVTVSKNAAAVSNQQYGLGVTYSACRQVRDVFLDQTYRRESGRSMFYEVSTETLNEIEGMLGEMNGEAFQTSIANLWTSVQELAKDPSSSVTQGLLVTRAAEFLERSSRVYSDLCDYQDSLNRQVKEQVEQINKYGKQIRELNEEITRIESGGIEHANDLRDARNQLLDELGKMAAITYSEDTYGNVTVQLEGNDFIKAGNVYEIGLDVDATTGFYTPFWKQNATYKISEDGEKIYDIRHAKVFDLDRTISSASNTDIGGLKGTLLARGNHRANYTDIENNYDGVSQSILMNVQAEFDQLIHNVVTSVNKILEDASDAATGYLRDLDGSPLQLFQKKSTAAYTEGVDAGGNKTWTYNEEDPENLESLYSCTNLQVNTSLQQQASLLGFTKKDGTVDYETAQKLCQAFEREDYKLNPNVQKKTSFVDYYSDLVAQVANSGYVFNSMYENQQTTVEATAAAREQIVGVSSDEELSNMIRFQNGFNASSRYINVISEMLEHLLSALG